MSDRWMTRIGGHGAARWSGREIDAFKGFGERNEDGS